MGTGPSHHAMFGRHFWASIQEPETTPKQDVEPSYDPHLGFDGKRAERSESGPGKGDTDCTQH